MMFCLCMILPPDLGFRIQCLTLLVISGQKLCGWSARLLDDGNIRMEIVGCGRLLDGKEVTAEEAKGSKAAGQSLLSPIVCMHIIGHHSIFI